MCMSLKNWYSELKFFHKKPCTPHFHSILGTRKSLKWETWLMAWSLGLVNKRKTSSPLQRTFYCHVPFALVKELLPCHFFCRYYYCKASQWQRQRYTIQITVEASYINWSYLSVLYLLEISMNYMKQRSCSPLQEMMFNRQGLLEKK